MAVGAADQLHERGRARQPDADVAGAAGRAGRVDPGRLDPRRLDPGLDSHRLDPGRIDPARLDPRRLDHDPAGQHRRVADRLDPGRVDPRRLDSRRLDPGGLDSSGLDRSAELTGRIDPGRLDPRWLDRLHLQPRVPDGRHAREQRVADQAGSHVRATAARDEPGDVRPHHVRRSDHVHVAGDAARLHDRRPRQQPAPEQRNDVRRRACAPAAAGLDRLGDGRPERDPGAELRDRRQHARLQRRLPPHPERRAPRRHRPGDDRRLRSLRLPVPAGDDETARRQRQRLRARSDPAGRSDRRQRRDARLGRQCGDRLELPAHVHDPPEPRDRPDGSERADRRDRCSARRHPDTRERHRRRHVRAEQHAGHGEADLERLVLPLVHHEQLRRRLLHVPGAAGRNARDVPPEPSAGGLRPRRVRPGGRAAAPSRAGVDAAARRRSARRLRLRDDARDGRARAADAERRRARTRSPGLRRLDPARDAGRRRRRDLGRRPAGRRLHRPGVGVQRRLERPALHAARRDDAAAGSARLRTAELHRHGHRRARARHDRRRPGGDRRQHALRRRRPAVRQRVRRGRRKRRHEAERRGDARRLRERRLPIGRRARRRERERPLRLHGVERVPGRPDEGQRRRLVDRPRDRQRAADVSERRVPRARRQRRPAAVCAPRRSDHRLDRERVRVYLPGGQRARRLAHRGEDPLRRPLRDNRAGAVPEPAARRPEPRHRPSRRDPGEHQRAARRLHRRARRPATCTRSPRSRPATTSCPTALLPSAGRSGASQSAPRTRARSRHVDEGDAARRRRALPADRRARRPTSSR